MGVHRIRPPTDEEVRLMWERHDKHVKSIGELCISWAVMDSLLDDLFEPLLQCSGLPV
jgi:hypothetical protein